MTFPNFKKITLKRDRPGYLSWCSYSLRAGRSGDRIPVGGEISRTRPERPWGPPSLLCNGYRVPFLGVKRPGSGIDHPPPSSASCERRVELYLCTISQQAAVHIRGLPRTPTKRRRRRAIPILHPWAFVVCYRVNFTFNFTFNIKTRTKPNISDKDVTTQK
jgi:hypothetical protein